MDKVAIYARVSTADKQEYDRQLSDLTSVILFHGYKDNQIEVFAEKLSGYKKERPELANLLSKAENYKCIYVTEISRLGRNPSHTRQIIDELTDKNIPVYIQSIGQSTIDKDGRRNTIMSIILQVLMEFAHLEAETTKSRMKSGKIQAVKEGGVHGANLAFGYKSDESKRLVIDEDESTIIRLIFKLCKEGNGTDLIAQRLNQLEIPTRRSITLKDKGIKLKGTGLRVDSSNIKWSNGVIRQIIKNSIYYGKRNYKGEQYDCPPIISEELYHQCNELITSRRSKRDEVQTYLLKHLIHCGVCGKPYMGRYVDTKKASKTYFCTANVKSKSCNNANIFLLYTESVFYNMFLTTNLDDFIDNPNDIKKTLESDLDKINIEIEGINNLREEKESEQVRLIQLYASGSFKMDTLNDLNDKLNEELSILNNKLNILKDRQLELKISLANYNENTTSKDILINARNNRQELRNIFNQMIDKVIVNKINDSYTLLTYFIKVKGVVIEQPLKIFLDIKTATRNKQTSERNFRYITSQYLTNEPKFYKNILVTKIGEIEKELYQILQMEKNFSNNQTKDGFKITNFMEVPEENWLMIGDSDK